MNLGKILWMLLLACFLLFSVGVLGYVIFFRTVTAAEVLENSQGNIIFEEGDLSNVGEPHLTLHSRNEEELPKVAIIIDDMGYHSEIGHDLLELSLDLTFSFLPHAPHTPVLEERAHRMDKTILLHLPMETRDKKWDPGPGTLYLGELSLLQELFYKNLQKVPHATGVNNHMGSLYTEDESHMEQLLKLIEEEELFYIDSFTTPQSVGLQLAQKMGIKGSRRHIFLDNIQTKENVCEQLNKLILLAEKQGEAIGIGHPFKATLEGLAECGDLVSGRVEVVGVEVLIH